MSVAWMDYAYPVNRVAMLRPELVLRACQRPYPRHPKGCPNYNKALRCPPKAPRFDAVFNTDALLLLVHSEFDLDAHVAVMCERFPYWSAAQCQNVLYWQSKSRKQLRERARTVAAAWEMDCITYCPEGLGVNVYATAALAGLKLEPIKNLHTCRHVAILGFAKKGGVVCPD